MANVTKEMLNNMIGALHKAEGDATVLRHKMTNKDDEATINEIAEELYRVKRTLITYTEGRGKVSAAMFATLAPGTKVVRS